MNREAQYLRHWAAMARLTEEQSSLLTADTLEALAGKFEELEAQNVALKDCVSKYAEAVELWNSWADKQDRLEPIPQTPPAPVVRVIELPAAERIEGYRYVFDMNDVFVALEAAGQPFKHGDGAVIQPKVSTPPAPVVKVPERKWSQGETTLQNDYMAMGWNECRAEMLRLNDNSTPPAPDAEVYAELYKLREQVKGAEGFATWKDAALHEKMKRLNLEKKLAPIDYLTAMSAFHSDEWHKMGAVTAYMHGWNACSDARKYNSAPATDNTAAQYESLKRGKTS